MTVPKSHPRYESLKKRERIIQGMRDGIVAEAGPIAHGRGEAFDYLLGERTHPEADLAEKMAAYHMILARHPVISVNGNTAVLVPDEMIELADVIPALLEINLFYRTEERVNRIVELLKSHGAKKVLGMEPDGEIPGLDHKRALCSKEGTMKADIILVPLEDGDRTLALKSMGKTVITIDLNPLSRTSMASDVSIVDEVTRAIPNIMDHVKKARSGGMKEEDIEKEIADFDNEKNLKSILKKIQDGALGQK
jgi:4-phosphopantoate--beta-alanine ligase